VRARNFPWVCAKKKHAGDWLTRRERFTRRVACERLCTSEAPVHE
jgi:hypothetical protein